LVKLLFYKLSSVWRFVFVSKRMEAVSSPYLNNEPTAVDKTADHLSALTKSLIWLLSIAKL